MPKFRDKSHETDKAAVNILEGKILALKWSFRSQHEDDYGIDAELERCTMSGEKRVMSGELFKVQIKGTEKLAVNKSGEITHELSKDDLEYLCKSMTVPALLVVVDVHNKEAYWFDLKKQGCELLDQKSDQKSYTLKTSATNKISPENAEEFDGFLRRAEYLSATENVIKQLTRGTFADAVSFASKIHQSFGISGHRPLPRAAGTPAHEGTVFSVTEDKKTVYDYVQTDDFRETDRAKVDFNLAFKNTPEGKQLAQDLRDCLQGKKSSVSLPSSVVQELGITVGGKKIDGIGSAEVHIMPVRKTTNLYLKQKGSTDEIRILGEIWKDEEGYVFDSTAFETQQPVTIKCTLRENGTAGFSFGLDPAKFRDCNHALSYMSILAHMHEGFEMSAEFDGVKRQIVKEAKATSIPLSSQLSERLRQAALVERTRNISFDVSKVLEASTEALYYLKIVADLIEKGSSTAFASISSVLHEKPKENLKGKFMRYDSEGPSTFNLFGQQIAFAEGIRSEGQCTDFKELPPEDGGYPFKVDLKECCFSLLKAEPLPVTA